MILTIDIGNTNVVLGGFGAGEEPEFVLRLPSTRGCPQAQWDQAVGECLARARKSKALERAFSTAIPPEVYEALEEQMKAGDGGAG